MTVRYVIVAIDDERELGPQMRAALKVLPWKIVHELVGNAYSLRWLREMVNTSEISERLVVAFGSMVPPQRLARSGGAVPMSGVVNSIFGGGGGGSNTVIMPSVAQPTAPTSNDANQIEAAREERLARSKQIGAAATSITDYALASQAPPVLKPTMGA